MSLEYYFDTIFYNVIITIIFRVLTFKTDKDYDRSVNNR